MQDTIIEKIKKSLKISCDEALKFSGDETHLIDAEYLLTVNIAKQINKLNLNYDGGLYEIVLESKTRDFATSCTPILGKKPADNFLGFVSVLRTANDTERKGKIDVAVYDALYSGFGKKPICAIEVKGFNPSQKRILDDLKRNANYFSLTSPTGSSILPFTCFVSLHSYRNLKEKENEKENEKKVKNRYQKYIEENELLKELVQKIEVITIRRGVMPERDDPHAMENGLQGDEDYHFLGVIVTTTKT